MKPIRRRVKGRHAGRAALRCNYMTRISNGSQLSLERDNVFFEYYADDQPKAETGQKSEAR
jgi:hypothetical protein